DQLTEEELAAKEAQLGKIQELEGQLLAVLDLNIQELKECGIERDNSKGLVQSVPNTPLLDIENLPTREQLEDGLTKYFEAYEKDAAFKRLLEAYEIAITKLEVAPNNVTLQADKVSIEAKLQAHGLYKGGVELLMISTYLRQAAEDEADRHLINSATREVPNVSASNLAIASKQSNKANQIKNNVIIPLRGIFGCPNSPESGRRVVSGTKGAAKSLEDTAKGTLILASLPVLLCKLGYKSAESIVKWEDKLGIKGKYGSAKEAIGVIFKEAKYDWENVEEYRIRQQAIRNYKKQMLAYNKAFNAEAYHCGRAEEFGYITMEAIQFFFGDAVIKAADGALKGSKAAKGVRVAEGLQDSKFIKAANGLEIKGFTKHGIHRAIGDFERMGVKTAAILDALKNPLKIGKIKLDNLGRKSQRFVGRFGEVVVNTHTGEIISVNPTRASKAARLTNKQQE
ncbi:MAG: hypothetical protein ACYC2U_07120, partial [Candidatus Amoebophilus sp.]